MISTEEEFVRLTIPLDDAVAFAMGWSNLGYSEPSDGMRRVVGVLAGSYARTGGGQISLGGIDPASLHQTTHAVSAEYLREML